jgi:hypothetical protein
MNRSRTPRRLALLAVAATGLIATGLIVSGAGATATTSSAAVPWSFQFLYTTAGANAAHASSAVNLWRGRYRVVRGHLLMQSAQPLAHVTGADGVLSLPDGRLLVRSSRGRLLLLGPRIERVIRTWDVLGAHNAVLDPSGRRAWVIARPGRLLELRLDGPGRARPHVLRGADRDLIDLAFDGSGHAYYTARGGNFGTLDLGRFVTHRLLAHVAGASSIVFDPSSGDLVLVGGGRLVQIDPRTATIVDGAALTSAVVHASAADRSAPPKSCGPASTDKRGTLLVACGRALAFVHLAAGSPGAVSVRRIDTPVTSLAPTILGRVDFGPYVKRKCRPHHCRLTLPTFTG